MKPVTLELSSGRHVLITASGSRHLVDLDRHTYQRLRAHVADGETAPDCSVESMALRRDGERITLVSRALLVTLGAPVILTLHGLGDQPGAYTTRTTAPILSVNRVVGDEPSDAS